MLQYGWFRSVLMIALLVLSLGCSSDDGGTTTPSESEDTVAAPDTTEEAGDATAEGTDTSEDQEDTGDAGTTEDPTDADAGEEPEPECVTADDCEFEELPDCKVPACDSVKGLCIVDNAEEGTACGPEADLCSSGGGTCDAEGECLTTEIDVACDDGNDCTEDTCEPFTGCVFTPNTNPCDDGDICTQTDACADGECGGTNPLNCDDDNACTIDLCDPVGGCLNDSEDLNGTLCDDGEPCTAGDTCSDGTCVAGEPALIEGSPACSVCSDENACGQTETQCDGTFTCNDGFCKEDPSTIPDCNDGDSCTEDLCNPLDGTCTSTPLDEGSACDDGDGCTTNTVCTEGECVGETVPDCIPGCVAKDTAGCDGCECQECVCDIDSFCCDVIWDESCVNLCEADCGVNCDPNAVDPGCITSFNTPGCDGCACEECVCESNSYCCATAWDSSCVQSCQDCGTTCPDQPINNCSDDEIVNCNGGCTWATWIGDGWCDSALDCEETGFDGGDCEPCYPSCDGFNCGGDGCGGTCGTCGDGEFCYDGVCGEHCGNGTCEDNLSEDCITCAADCGECIKGSGCEKMDQPTCGGCSCEACVCEADSVCCDVAWDSSCILTCITDCGGCDYDAGCFENITPAVDGADGACSGDEVACTTNEDCAQPEPCPAPNTCLEDPACAATPPTCQEDGTCAADGSACSANEECPGAPSPCDEFAGLCSEDDSACETDEDCPTEACEEPAPNVCEGVVEATPETPVAGCDGCACETCVCDAHPECCDTAWDESCAVACQTECDVPCGLDTCEEDIDCFDGDACTLESCGENGLCVYDWSDACCQNDAECDDGDSCTANTCNAFGQCELSAAFDAACCPEAGDVFSVGFEETVPFTVNNSSPAGGWQISSNQANGGTHSLWYGSKITGDLNFGPSSGTLTSDPILLPDSYTLSLEFYLYMDFASTVSVRVVLADGTEELIWQQTPGALNEWSQETFNLTPWHGQLIQLQFFFNSTGTNNNGVYLDDISILSDCVYPVCGDGTCNGDEDCFLCGDDCAYPDTCPQNDGCLAWDNPGCVDCVCQESVCETNPECCDVMWDQACVQLCNDSGLADCLPGPGCVTTGTPGCDGCECEDCVCAADSFCCATGWDGLCVSTCQGACGQNCPPPPPEVCSDGYINNCTGGCTLETWLADGICDSVLNCEEFDYDEGDCDTTQPDPFF